MERIEKTVFISYRRTNVPWALAIFQNLTQFGYDVFFDFNGIASGDFDTVIVENIKARAHFLVILTPSALERCGEPGDWLRREIETAFECRRNIVPLMLEGFDFGTPAIASQLTGTLAPLKQYNALNIPADYFMEAMGRLRDRFLNIPVDAVPQPASLPARQAATQQKQEAAATPAVAGEELTAQQWFERAVNAVDPEEQIRFYSNAIRLKPDYAAAFNNRGNVRAAKGDFDSAIEDFDAAIRIDPAYAFAFNSRSNVRSAKRDFDGAIEDCNEAIRLKPDYAEAYSNRGYARQLKGDLEGALQDCNQAISLKPDYAEAFNNRGFIRCLKGDVAGGLRDCDEAIRLRPTFALAFDSRGLIRRALGDLKGALQDFNEAIRLKPDSAVAIANRDSLLKQMADQSNNQTS